MTEKYEKNIYLAMLAEQCSRFEDMMNFLEEMVIGKSEDLSSDERNLLSIAYKNTISLRRTAVRTLLAYQMKEQKKTESHYLPFIMEYKAKVEEELIKLCQRVISIIDTHLLPRAKENESKVFYYKMKGDYYRYIAENVEGELKKANSDNSLKAYNDAGEFEKNLPCADPIRLGLALNKSVFYYEVFNDSESAIKIAKETLDMARNELQGVDEDDEQYRDAFAIINLIQENLNMWTVDMEN